MSPRTAIALSLLAAVALFAAGSCRGPRLTAIGSGWFVDETPPGQAWPHLYHETDGARVVVDVQVEAYRLYAGRCLIYQAPRADDRFLFVVWGGTSPVPFRGNAPPGRWRLDADGPRRFEEPLDRNGRLLLETEWINFGDPCTLAQLQPRFTKDWARTAQFLPDRVKSEKESFEVNGTDSVGNCTLSGAARKGRVVLVDELLRAGADPNSSNNSGFTVLMSSTVHSDVALRLIKAGARVDTQDVNGQTALMWAARYGSLELVKVLLDAGAKATIRDDHGRTAAAWAPDSDRDAVRQLRALLNSAGARGK